MKTHTTGTHHISNRKVTQISPQLPYFTQESCTSGCILQGKNEKSHRLGGFFCDPPGLTCDPVGLISFTELLTHAKLLCLRGLSIVIVLSLNVLNLGTFLVAHLVAH